MGGSAMCVNDRCLGVTVDEGRFMRGMRRFARRMKLRGPMALAIGGHDVTAFSTTRTLTKQERARIRDEWESSYRGTGRSRKTVILDSGLTRRQRKPGKMPAG